MKKIKNSIQFISREGLKLIAMLLMLLDHTYMTVVSRSGFGWMTMVGRIAFPLFAFQIVEGYLHTHSKKSYIRTMLLFALISEIPYNLMMGGELIGPFHQNVMFSFLIALLLLVLLERIYGTEKLPLIIKVILIGMVCLLGVVAGTITLVDFSGFGVLTVLVFYIARRMPGLSQLPRITQQPHLLQNLHLPQDCLEKVTQIAGLWMINGVFLGGKVVIFSNGFEFPEQGLALLSLLFIWMYNGKKALSGSRAAVFKYCAYLFYPVHILILSLIALQVF